MVAKATIIKHIIMKPIIFALAAVFLFGCSSNPQPGATPPPSLPVVTIKSGSDTTYQDYPALVEGTLNVEIRPQVSGTLDKVFVDEGAFVKKGDPILKINEQPFRAAFNNALASLHATQGAMENANLEIEKLTPLVQSKVVSEYQLKTATATAYVAKANVEQANANVATARINLGYTLINAPVSGYIGRLLKKKGSLVAPGDTEALTLLSDVHEVHVYFALGENDFVSFKDQYVGETLKDKLKKLPPVTLILSDNLAYIETGRVDMIDGQFDNNTGAITLRASFPNSKGLLRSGNTGKIRLSLLHKDALIVPTRATVEMQDKIFVFALADNNKVKKQALTIVGKSGNNYLVKEGVKAGDRIVLSGLDNLQEGTTISPQITANTAANIASKK
jgi:membrane fusion protein (multidrug efflux system)